MALPGIPQISQNEYVNILTEMVKCKKLDVEIVSQDDVVNLLYALKKCMCNSSGSGSGSGGDGLGINTLNNLPDKWTISEAPHQTSMTGPGEINFVSRLAYYNNLGNINFEFEICNLNRHPTAQYFVTINQMEIWSNYGNKIYNSLQGNSYAFESVYTDPSILDMGPNCTINLKGYFSPYTKVKRVKLNITAGGINMLVNFYFNKYEEF